MATILLVDDDPDILEVFRHVLELDGYVALTATDGESAFALASGERPALIVTDCRMPRVDGVSLCRRLRSETALATIPVVMLSASALPPVDEFLWDVFLRKPAAASQLLETIQLLLTPPPPATGSLGQMSGVDEQSSSSTQLTAAFRGQGSAD
ncbi:response regulator [Burkholderia multivorans]|nr:response regulator [Burkholderia multivorans]